MKLSRTLLCCLMVNLSYISANNPPPNEMTFQKMQNFSITLDYLKQALSISQCIVDRNESLAVSNSISKVLLKTEDLYNLKDYEQLELTLIFFYENIDEILAECNDENVKNQIMSVINEMFDRLNIRI